MKEYHKINTIFKRDQKTNKIILNDWSEPEFELLKDIKWIGTEKIDGTNIRVLWNGFNVSFEGKTDKAEIPKHLLEKLFKLFPIELMEKTFGKGYDVDENGDDFLKQVCLYGEGYGKKIQKGGNYISDDVNFILFDIKIGNWILSREKIEEIALSMNINIVPVLGEFTLDEAIDYVKQGFISTISENREYIAEGLVLKPKCELFKRNGQRVITKIKYIDFK